MTCPLLNYYAVIIAGCCEHPAIIIYGVLLSFGKGRKYVF